MTQTLLMVLGLAAVPTALFGQAAQAPVTVEVAVIAPGDHGYSLMGGGTMKVGRTSSAPGYTTVEDRITVARPGPYIPVGLTFSDMDGPVSVCPTIDVVVLDGKPSCAPRFTLTTTQLGFRDFLCEVTCPPAGGAP